MFGAVFPTLVLSWCLAAAGHVSCWGHSPDDAKAEKPSVPPMRMDALGTRRGDHPLNPSMAQGAQHLAGLSPEVMAAILFPVNCCVVPSWDGREL